MNGPHNSLCIPPMPWGHICLKHHLPSLPQAKPYEPLLDASLRSKRPYLLNHFRTERQGNRYLPATIHGKLPHKDGPLRGVSDISCEGELFKWGLQPPIGAIGPAPPSVELFDPKQWQALTKLLARLRRVFRNSLEANIRKITSATFQHVMTL